MKELIGLHLIRLLNEIATVDGELIILVLLFVVAAIVLDGATAMASKMRKQAGIEGKGTTVSIDGSESLPVRNYVSPIQGLAGKPDALIREGGFIIPIERKPLAKKIHDRYIAQLLVYMRLIEEFEGKRPPYGYLILGSNCRRFKIDNTPQRQAWLQNMIDDMRGVLKGGAAKPDPHPMKCKKCYVRDACSHKIIPTPNANRPVTINPKRKEDSRETDKKSVVESGER